MGKRYTMFNKAKVQQILWTYEDRRRSYRSRGMNTAKISTRIHNKRKTLRKLEEKEESIRNLAFKVKEFTGVELWKSSSNMNKDVLFAKGLFSKWGIEHNIKGNSLGWYLGTRMNFIPARHRRRLNKELQIDVKILQKWTKFKDFMAENN